MYNIYVIHIDCVVCTLTLLWDIKRMCLWTYLMLCFALLRGLSAWPACVDGAGSISGAARRGVREVWVARPSVNNPPRGEADRWVIRDDWIKQARTVCQNNEGRWEEEEGKRGETQEEEQYASLWRNSFTTVHQDKTTTNQHDSVVRASERTWHKQCLSENIATGELCPFENHNHNVTDTHVDCSNAQSTKVSLTPL